MKKEQRLTCILCPVGCGITVKTDGDKITDIEGYTCLKGKKYAEEEVTDPKRTLTTTVRVQGGKEPLVSVKSAQALPKDKLLKSMDIIARTAVKAPLNIGDVIVPDILGTGVDIVATCRVDEV